MSGLAGRRALVTGAARGIGLAIAERLLRDGASVTLSDVDGDLVAWEVDRLVREGLEARAVRADVTVAPAVDAMMGAAVGEDGALDILVCNVGVAEETPFTEQDPASWDRQVALTLTATATCCRAALPFLVRSRHGGRIVNIGSVNGLAAYGHEAYSAAKAAVVNLTQNLAQGHGPAGVRANVVAPGTILTSAWEARVAADPDLLDRLRAHVPLGGLGRPADVAAACAFLVSDEAQWITGAVLTVDGGLTSGNFALRQARELEVRDDT